MVPDRVHEHRGRRTSCAVGAHPIPVTKSLRPISVEGAGDARIGGVLRDPRWHRIRNAQAAMATPTNPPYAPDASCHVLLVDDDASVQRLYARALRRVGYEETTAGDVTSGLGVVRDAGIDIDVVVTDMALPDGTGIDVLDVVRAERPAVPVIFVTGSTEVELAVRALERGALRYLMKPVDGTVLCQAVEAARRIATALTSGYGAVDAFGAAGRDLANLDVRFDSALEGLSVAYQPIVSWSQRKLVAYEALVRTREASLRRPDRFVIAAERLGRLNDLGRRVRNSVARTAAELPPGVDVHVNLHPMDLTDPELFDRAAPLTRVAHNVVLELTERTALDRLGDVRDRVEELRGLGFRIALDDLGAGYASLSSLALLRPEQVKLDLSLVRGIARDLTRQVLVGAVREVCARMGMSLICEGVEDGTDLAALVTAGCDMLQGFLFARPGELVSDIDWDRVRQAVPASLLARDPAQQDTARHEIDSPEGRSTARFSNVGAIAATLARDAQSRLGRLHQAADRLCEQQVSADQFDLAHEIAVGAEHLEGSVAALVELIERGGRLESA